MPYDSEPHLWYGVFTAIKEISEQRPGDSLDSPSEFFKTQLTVLTKNHGYVREFLWKNWRDLRLAVEDCWKLNASPPPSISFTVTSLFLRRLSSQKEPADRILADL